MSQIWRMSSSNTPCVEGYVIIRHASLLAMLRPCARRSSTSTLPSARAPHDDDAHAGRDGAGRIGAMGGRGNEHDVALRLTSIAVIRANHHQARELSLRP